jgi:hypothetical protein
MLLMLLEGCSEGRISSAPLVNLSFRPNIEQQNKMQHTDTVADPFI